MCVRSPRIIPHLFSCVELVSLVAAEFRLLHPIVIKKKKESLEERALLSFLSIGSNRHPPELVRGSDEMLPSIHPLPWVVGQQHPTVEEVRGHQSQEVLSSTFVTFCPHGFYVPLPEARSCLKMDAVRNTAL